jgi:2,4-dienoyl-CoA reductase-like NADH-dependent reductase (Old Yellow Enzyme family)/pyruvate/2-oxoglutarate dehydrogenase complex dihydrolipoamide dehydrogenase (E3) component
MFSNVLQKGYIGSLELKNRFVVPPMGSSHGELDGSVGQELIDYYAARARGGFGLIITEYTCIDPVGKAAPDQLMIYSDDFIPGLTKLTEAIHKEGGKIAVQLHHAGRETSSAVSGFQPVAPSSIPCPLTREIPRELSTEEVYELIEKYGDAAVRAKKSGFDAVEIHGAHGYMVAQFLSGYSNKRVDEFGGSLNGRMKFAIDIIKNIKKKCGQDFPIIFRISGDEKVDGGRQIEETAVIAKALAKAGADAIHVSVGVYGSMQWIIAPSSIPQGYLLSSAAAVKKAVDVPVIAVGRITEPEMAENVVASGIADFVALGRGSLADPEFPNKVAENRVNEIIPCVGCLTRCQDTTTLNPEAKGISCMLNPFTGHEGTMKITPTAAPKKVVVVGGGPGGLEAAWVAAARGHKVTLLEKGNTTGGQFLSAAIPPGKHELARGIRVYNEMCKKYKVDVRLGQEADTDMVLSLEPDAVILATGAIPAEPQIPKEGNIPVVQAVDALLGKVMLGNNVLVVGGGMVGLETAEHLISQNRKATIVEMLDDVGSDISFSTKYFILQTLKNSGVEIHTQTKVEKFTDDGAICTDPDGTFELSGFDMVILAVGAKSYNPLERELAGKVKELYVIGDAAEPRKAVEAIDEGAKIALKL